MLVSTTLAGPGAEASIVDALRSCSHLVDAHLVFIRGADEDAVQKAIAESDAGGIELFRRCIFDRKAWPDDYGLARTEALRWAESFGAGWALTVDCDERLEIERFVPTTTDYDVAVVHDRELLYSKPRFLRCGAGLRWEGKCSERLLTADGSLPTPVRVDGCFWELPKTEAQERARAERGVAFVMGLAERDASHRRHLAECFLTLGEDDLAGNEFEKVAHDPAAPMHERTWCRYRLAELACVHGFYEQARADAAEALAEDPGLIQELGWVLAHANAQLKNYTAAALWASYVLQAPIDWSRAGHRSATWKPGATKLLADIQAAADAQRPREFTPANFAARHEFQADYDLLAKALVNVLGAGCIDLGAGNGLLVDAMMRLDAFARGIEANPAAAEAAVGFAPGNTDYGVPLERWATWSAVRPQQLVTCIEVGEHIPAERADELVDACIANSSRWIVFSAAQPGQGGIGHVNEQPPWYWSEKFAARGWSRSEVHLSAILSQVVHMQKCWWIPRNLMVFRKL